MAVAAVLAVITAVTPRVLGWPDAGMPESHPPPEDGRPAASDEHDETGPQQAAPDDPGAPSEVSGQGHSLDIERPVTLRLLAVRFLPRASLAVVDLERGEVTSYPPGAHGLTREAVDGATVIDAGVVVWQSDATVRVFSGDLSEPSLEHTPADLERSTPDGAAPSITALPTHDGKGLWVVQAGGCCADVRVGQAELVDLATGEVRITAELPPKSSPIAAVPGGLVLNTLTFVETGDGWIGEEGSHRVLLMGEDGVVAELSAGEALAATGDHAAVIECGRYDPRGGCRLGLVDIATGERWEVAAPVEGTWEGVGVANTPTNSPPWAAVARHDRILVGIRGDRVDSASPHMRTRYLVVVDSTGPAPTASVVYEAESKHLSAAWDAVGEHIVVADAMEPHLTVIDARDGSSFTVRDAIPADHFLVGMR